MPLETGVLDAVTVVEDTFVEQTRTDGKGCILVGVPLGTIIVLIHHTLEQKSGHTIIIPALKLYTSAQNNARDVRVTSRILVPR